jgi:hypothetical protein
MNKNTFDLTSVLMNKTDKEILNIWMELLNKKDVY